MMFDPKMLQVYLVGGTQDVHNDVVKFLEKVELAMKSGITAFQYREKGNSKLRPNERVDLGLELRTLCTRYGIPLIVDDDYELAQQINADGVHVGQNDTKIEQVSVAVGHPVIHQNKLNVLIQWTLLIISVVVLFSLQNQSLTPILLLGSIVLNV